MNKKLTVKEYADSIGKTKEAVFYQIKKGTINAIKDEKNQWKIILKDERVQKKEPKNSKERKPKKQDNKAIKEDL